MSYPFQRVATLFRTDHRVKPFEWLIYRIERLFKAFEQIMNAYPLEMDYKPLVSVLRFTVTFLA